MGKLLVLDKQIQRKKDAIWKQKLEIIKQAMTWILECKLFRLGQELIFANRTKELQTWKGSVSDQHGKILPPKKKKAGSLSTQWQGRKKKKTGWLHSKGTDYLYVLSNISKHSKEILQQSTFDDATMCHIYKLKRAKTFWLLRFDSFIWEENDNDQVKHCILLALAYGKPSNGLFHEKWFPRHRQLPLGDTLQSGMDGSNI